MPSDAVIILQAKSTLAQACVETGVTPSEDALYWLLGLVWGESRFGQTESWTIPNALNNPDCDGQTPPCNPGAAAGPSHNWGAVHSVGNAPFVWHGDLDANKRPVVSKFARFTTQLDGAKNFLRTINRNAAKAVIGGQGSARDLAAAMFANHYYTGTCPPNCTDDAKIDAYANMIVSGANKVRAVVGAGPGKPSSPALSPEKLLPGPTYVPGTADGFPWATLAILGAVGIGGTLLLAHHNPNGIAAKVVEGVASLPRRITKNVEAFRSGGSAFAPSSGWTTTQSLSLGNTSISWRV